MTRSLRRTTLTTLFAATVLTCAGCGGNGLESVEGDGSSATATPRTSTSPHASSTPTRKVSPSAAPSVRSTPRPAPGPTSTRPAASHGATPVVHVYAGGESVGLSLTSDAAAARLVDPPAGFAAYALGRRTATPPTQLVVAATSTDGWASGGTEDLHDGRPGGGYVAIWHDTGSGWTEPLGTQDEFLCTDLHRLGVPAYPVGPQQCADGQRSLDYVP